MSYIVKNCPATGAGCCGDTCPEITDCPLKQIVEYCKTTRDVYCYGQKHNIRWIDANNILKKIDIQEVE